LTGESSAKIDIKSVVGFWLFDQQTGDTVKDNSGNGNDATIVSGKLSDGKFGKALLLNGTSDFAKTGTQLINPAEGTITLFLRSDNPTKSDQHLIYTGAGGDGWCDQNEFHLAFRNGSPLNFTNCSNKLQGCDPCRVWDVVSSVTPVKGQWHHLAATWKQKEFARIYVDGALSGEKAPVGEINSKDWELTVYIGRPSANTRFFEGAIDEVAIFDAVLTDDDIERIMNNGLEKALGISAVFPSDKLATTWGLIKFR
jgi:hypothetical protein